MSGTLAFIFFISFSATPRKWLLILPNRLREVNSFKVTQYKAEIETVCN